MKRRIFNSLAFISVLSIILATVLISLVFYNASIDSLKQTVQNEAALLKLAYSSEIDWDDADLLAIQQQAYVNENTRLTVIDASGTVLYDNYADASSMENHAERPEVISAFETGSGEDFRSSDTLRELTYYYAVSLSDNYVLRVASTADSALATVFSMIPLMCVVCLLAFVAALLLASVQTRRVVQPINEIDLDRPNLTEYYDELAPLLRRIQEQNRLIEAHMKQLELKQSEFTAITDNMTEGFLVLNDRAEILSYNKAVMKLFGITDGIQKNLNVLAVNRSPAFRDAVDTALKGLPFDQNLMLAGNPYQLIANPVLQEDGVTGAVMVLLDIGEREAREQMRREFSANVSHELKTPLTSISGYAEIIKNGMVKPVDVPRFAEHIYNEAGRLIVLIGDIIKLSQLDETSVELPDEAVDMYDLGREVVARLQSSAVKNQVRLHMEGESATVRGVRQILDEMIYNLCDNAIRYNRAGGEVLLSVTVVNERVVVSVKDNGIGIPEADQERVFERFYRVDKSHSKVMGGTGLGLSIVKHGAQYHHASLSLESTEQVGTTITIVF